MTPSGEKLAREAVCCSEMSSASLVSLACNSEPIQLSKRRGQDITGSQMLRQAHAALETCVYCANIHTASCVYIHWKTPLPAP